MVLVVGLGNPGKAYEATRHNVGFRLLDRLIAARSATNISKASFKGELYRAGEALFLKPATFMNLSGESALPVTSFYKPEKIIVAHDDLDLPFGAIRLKRGGGHGGHNGLKSLDKHLGNDYHRLRIGIGKPPKGWETADYVLAKFTSEEEEKLSSVLLPHAAEALEVFLEGVMEWERIVSRYSLKPPKPAKESSPSLGDR